MATTTAQQLMSTEAQEIEAHWIFIMYPLKNLQQRTLQHGTTTACYFATIHLEATKELCKAAGKFKNVAKSHIHTYYRIILNTCSATYGQRALVGIVSMDYQRKSPEFYRENTKQSLQSTRRYEQSNITSHTVIEISMDS